jgi:hypothetical protein
MVAVMEPLDAPQDGLVMLTEMLILVEVTVIGLETDEQAPEVTVTE